MTSIPANLSVIREDFEKGQPLAKIKAAMEAANTEYVMVVGKNDIVDVAGPLVADVHYLPTQVGTRRAVRYSRPVLPYDPALLAQFNYMGLPIVRKTLVPLFPETAVEPWHMMLVKAQLQGASFGLLDGSLSIIESWPRPKLSGAYAEYHHSLDPEATMLAVPTVLAREINQQPYFTLREARAETIKVFCCNCSDEFRDSLSAPNVSVETIVAFDYDRIRTSNTTYVAWFHGIDEAAHAQTLIQLQTALEFPGVGIVSPRLTNVFSVETFHTTANGILNGFSFAAWMARTCDLGPAFPTTGYTNMQAVLRKIT